MDRYASRKLWLALVTLASASWLAVEKVIESGDWKAVVIGVVGAYMLGNVGSAYVASKTSEPSA